MTGTFAPGVRIHLDNFQTSYQQLERLSYEDAEPTLSLSRISFSSLSSSSSSTDHAVSACAMQILPRSVITIHSPLRQKIEELEKLEISYEVPEECDPLKELVHYGLKGCVNRQITKLDAYGVIHNYSYAANRLKYARAVLQEIESGKNVMGITTSRDLDGLLRIIQNRFLRLYYFQKQDVALKENDPRITNPKDRKIEKVIDEVIENILLLDHPESAKVIALEDGTTFFSIIGRAQGHVCSYEFRKCGEEYFFIIHDRSSSLSAVANWMRGPLRVRVTSKTSLPKWYSKTSLCIKTSREALTNRDFIKSILRVAKIVPFAEIHLFLIKIYQGKIVESEIEPLIHRLSAYREMRSDINRFGSETLSNIDTAIIRCCKRDLYMHSEQIFVPACNEVNGTQVEKVVPGCVTKGLKLDTIEKIEENLKSRLMTLPANGAIYLKGSEFNTQKTSHRYQVDADNISFLVNKKKEYLVDKLKGKMAKKPNLQETILLAKNLLAQLDAFRGEEFLKLKQAAQERYSRALPSRKKYVLEKNHDFEYYFGLLPDFLRRDTAFMLEIIQPHPGQGFWSLQALFKEWKKNLSDDLKNDRGFMGEAARINFMAFDAAADALKSDEIFIKPLLEIQPWILIYTSVEIRNKPEYIAKLPGFPVNPDEREEWFDTIPEDLKENKNFKNKFGSSYCSANACSIQ